LLDAAGTGADRGVLLPVDQGEKLVTQCPAADRTAFLDLLADGLQGATALRVVITLRSEYLSELVAGTALEGKVAPVITVGRLSRGGRAEVIERRAQRAGIDYEDGLVSRMVEDTAGRDAGGDPLPLLAFTLRQLYEHRADPTRITFDDYTRV